MSPKHSALDILLTLTYKGASGVIIVCKDIDPEIETIYRNEIRENLGSGIPTRVISVDIPIDEFKKNEIHHVFDDVVEEILAKKTASKKKPVTSSKKKKDTKKKTTKKKPAKKSKSSSKKKSSKSK